MEHLPSWLHSIEPYMDIKLLSGMAVAFGARAIGALAVFIVGRWLAGKVTEGLRRGLTRAHVDPTLVSFLANITFMGMLVFVIIVSINQLGIQTTSIAAIIAAAGLAVGLALQGSLSNFAAGVLIILYRPFYLGDLVKVGDKSGRVEEISMFTTSVRMGDNTIIIVPNSKMTSDTLYNYSRKPSRRVDLSVPVSYDADIDTIRRVILQETAKMENILKDPEPVVKVAGMTPYGVTIGIELWGDTPVHDAIQDQMNENIWRALKKAGVPLVSVPGWNMQEAA